VEALVIDLDGRIVVCHSEKEQAAPTFKHSLNFLGSRGGAGWDAELGRLHPHRSFTELRVERPPRFRHSYSL